MATKIIENSVESQPPTLPPRTTLLPSTGQNLEQMNEIAQTLADVLPPKPRKKIIELLGL